jgi:hypothetical protein
MNIVVKVDVEGHEAHVLRGMQNLIAANTVLLQVEIFEEKEEHVLSICKNLGLVRVHKIAVDHYFIKAT